MILFCPLLCGALFSLLALDSVGGVAQTNPTSSAVTMAPTDKNLLYVGRWDRSVPGHSHGNWIGSYVRTDFTGTSVAVTLGGHSGMDVSIDGEPTRVVMGGPGGVPLNLAPLATGRHTLLVGVKGGGGWDFQGLVLGPGAATKPPARRPLIEFIGDSISCCSPGPIEAAGNYTWQTAEALGCDHTQIAWPGRTLTTGYGCQDDKVGFDTQYFQQNCFYETPKAPWNFSTYTPQIVVINLGQNDGCGGESNENFQASDTKFIQTIRAKFSHAQIMAFRPFGGGYAAAVQKAVTALNTGGDAHVHYVDTTDWLQPADFSDGVHPNNVGNLKAAMHLAPLLRPLLAPKIKGAASPATVGDPATPNTLAQALQNAYIRGERRIVITPGTYRLSNNGEAQITLSQWQNAVIRADKVTLILDNRSAASRLFLLDHCVNVTLQGPLLSQTKQTAYQGRVTAIGKDADGKPNCDWRPSTGYPVPTAEVKELWINVVDAKTRTVNLRAGDYYHTKLEPLAGGAYRLHLGEDRPVNFAVGDWIVARYGNPPNKVFLSSCRNCTLKDVTMMRNGFAPIFDSEGAGNHILQCHWVLGPRPDGATEDSIVTNAADGIHSPDANPGPDIEDCTFEGVFLDDCIAIHGGFHKIIRVNGPILVARNDYAFYHVGEPVRISNTQGFYLQANVSALKDNGDGTSTLTLDSQTPVPTNASMSNPLYDGHGYKIINCRLGNTRSRGIIVKADDGVIQGNIISHCGLGLYIGPEWSSEADYCRNVSVEGNTFLENNNGIIVDGAGVKQNRRITIKNNHFVSSSGHDVSVAWTDGVSIMGNAFAKPSGDKPTPSISVRDAQNVRIGGNLVKTPDAYSRPFVNIGPNVAQITQDVNP